MQLKFFKIPAHDAGGFAEELNAFLRGHRILSVEREFCHDSGGAYWAVCVEYLVAVPTGAAASANGTGKGKIDYRERLSAEDFTVFSALREVRKELAERDGVPVYAVFTNEQIAEMVTRKANSLAALRQIDGVGDSRIEKYGDRFVAVLLQGERTHPAGSVPHPAERSSELETPMNNRK
jgi:superfamily II DNA helicase RecQ